MITVNARPPRTRANTGSAADGSDNVNTYAKRDIAAGEELLDDYGVYDTFDWYEAICSEYGVESLAVVAEKYD